jgi:hypothetical protein
MRFCVHLGASLSVLALLGCTGSGGGGPPVVPVSGKVMLDGKALAKANITFQPIGDDGKATSAPESTGVTDDDGHFTLKCRDGREGAVVGKHRVDISQIDRERKPMNIVPSKYNTESQLKFTVPEGGSKEANFTDLKSK